MATSTTSTSEPIYTHDQEAEVDEFERKDFAQRIAKTVLQQPLSHSSLIVSIVGPWGSGKSTVLKYIRDELAQDKCKVSNDPYKVANFNPWRYSGEDTLLLHLFTELVHAVDPDLAAIKKWQEMERAAKQRTRLGKLGANLAGLAAHLHTPGSGTLVQSAISSILPEEFKIRLDEIKEEVSLHLSRSKLRVIMPIDDVDRLDPQEILLLFRSLKLIADLPNTTFIIAMDEEHVSQVIGKHIDGNPETGRRYIEKIVNVRLTLPAIPDHILEKHTLERLSKVLERADRNLSREDSRYVRRVFERLHTPFIKTPRTAKALQNALTFALGLLPSDEVNTGDVLLLEATRVIHPSIYQAIQKIIPNVREIYNLDHQAKYKQEQEAARKRWAYILDPLKHNADHQIEEAKKGLQTWFPQIESVSMANETQWRDAKRICSASYFWRYFSGTIQKDDIHDSIVTDWFQRAISNQDGVKDDLASHLSKPYAAAFLSKIRYLCTLSTKFPKPVLLAVVHAASRLPQTVTNYLAGDAQIYVESMLAALMDKVTDEQEWEDLVVQFIRTSGNLEWSLNLRHNLRTPKSLSEKGKDPNYVSKHVQEFAERCLVAYDGDEFRGDNETFAFMASMLIHASQQQITFKKKLRAAVRKHPSLALRLLSYACSLRLNFNPKSRCWGHPNNQILESIENVISRQLLKRALKTVLPPIPSKVDNNDDDDDDDDDNEYLTLEEVGWACLETMKKRDAEAKA